MKPKSVPKSPACVEGKHPECRGCGCWCHKKGGRKS